MDKKFIFSLLITKILAAGETSCELPEELTNSSPQYVDCTGDKTICQT